MKWFKHFTNAHDGKFVKHIFRKFGLEGESRYFRLVGLLASKYPPDKKGFYTVSIESIRELLRHRSLNDCRSFLDHLATYRPPFTDRSGTNELFIVEYSENDCRIRYDKLQEIKDNHTTNLQATSKRLKSDLALKEDLKNKNKSKRKIKKDSPLFSFFEIWKSEMEPKGYRAPPALVDQEFQDAFQAFQDSFSGNIPSWSEYFIRIHASDFLREIKFGGKPTALWAANSENFHRVLAGDFDNSKKSKVDTPAIVDEITKLVRTYGPSDYEIILQKASTQAKLVLESTSQALIRDSNEFELKKLISNTFKEIA